jgi:hypothetical protein
MMHVQYAVMLLAKMLRWDRNEGSFIHGASPGLARAAQVR